MNKKEQMNVVIVGHVDHGKSTVIGRLMADTGSLPMGKIEQIKAQCEKNSKPFEYAFLLDALKDERSQGITIDTARCFFKTAKRDYIIIDAPGHIEFLKNMITGASRAEAAFLVIDAHEGVQENSRRHGYLLSMLGIKQIVVLVNKMDMVGYSEDHFNAVRDEYQKFLDHIKVSPLHYIPIAAREGDNIASLSGRMPWHKGFSVLTLIDTLKKEKDREGKPFRMFVQDIYKFTESGDDRRIFAGTVESGRVSVGDTIRFLPSGKQTSVKSIEVFNAEKQTSVSAGCATGLTLTEQIYVKPGELIFKNADEAPIVSSSVKVSIFWVGKKPMVKNKRYKLKIGTAKVAVFLDSIINIIDASSLTTEKNKEHIDRHDVAECVLKTLKPIAFDAIGAIETTGRFVIVDDYEISGGGIVIDSMEDENFVLEHVKKRNFAWVRSSISPDARVKKFNQRSKFIVITSSESEKIQATAARLEEELFASGRNVYYLGMANLSSGIDSDISGNVEDREEHLRRLGELAFMFVDAGTIIIATIPDLDDYECGFLELLLKPYETIVIAQDFTYLNTAHTLLSGNEDEIFEKINRLLYEKEILLDYHI